MSQSHHINRCRKEMIKEEVARLESEML